MEHMRSARTSLSFLVHDLQVLDNSFGARELKVVLSRLESGVGDLAVVKDDGEALSAALFVGPADALGELGLGVGKEELRDFGQWQFEVCRRGEGRKRTMSSFLTPLALPQALMTKASL